MIEETHFHGHGWYSCEDIDGGGLAFTYCRVSGCPAQKCDCGEILKDHEDIASSQFKTTMTALNNKFKPTATNIMNSPQPIYGPIPTGGFTTNSGIGNSPPIPPPLTRKGKTLPATYDQVMADKEEALERLRQEKKNFLNKLRRK